MDILKKVYTKLFRKGHPFLIFIVEDDVIYAKTLEFYLKNNLCAESEILYFPVGELAVENFHLKPDLILMDYHLNSSYFEAVDGIENIKIIKTSYPKTHVILLSSQKRIEVAVEAFAEYACYYVVKDNEALRKLAKIINHKIKEKEERAIVAYAI
ncbi:MAG: response regulator [Bacteroidetes bacterium]|nr:response regulator [Bacteroidota bacterium]